MIRLFLLLSILPTFLYSQDTTLRFRSPIDFPILLSANFGELRGNHFHNGIDIKTGGSIGKKVYAIEKGYVSRIKIAANGYGKVLYITHPNGLVSVYAHLNSFSKIIQNYCTNYQYENKLNEVDFDLAANELPVKKGDVIALSGNSGSSQGPHIHFEIRDEISEIALNPLEFYPEITDNAPPKISRFRIFPLDDSSFINGKNKIQDIIPLQKSKTEYYLSSPIYASGYIGFGISGMDNFSYVNNNFGFHEVSLYNDDSLLFSFDLDEMNFNDNLYINSLIDYTYFKNTGKRIQKTFIDANNKNGMYISQIKDGKLFCNNAKVYNLKLEVKDFNSNSVSLTFQIFSDTLQYQIETDSLSYNVCKYYKSNFLKSDHSNILIPKGALYTTEKISIYENTSSNSDLLCPIVIIGSEQVPLHAPFKLSINIDSIERNKHHLLQIVSVKNNRAIKAHGGKCTDHYITAELKNFGSYSVAIDTIPPTIQTKKLYNNIDLQNRQNITFRINDNLSGIASYNAYIDDKWVILDYDMKYNSLKLSLDNVKYFKKNKHHLILEVSDYCGNLSKFEVDFFK